VIICEINVYLLVIVQNKKIRKSCIFGLFNTTTCFGCPCQPSSGREWIGALCSSNWSTVFVGLEYCVRRIGALSSSDWSIVFIGLEHCVRRIGALCSSD
jgi:hypothetical protein